MLNSNVINKLCSDFLMSFVDDSVKLKNVEPITVNYEDKDITMIALGTNMSDEQLENYLSFILGV